MWRAIVKGRKGSAARVRRRRARREAGREQNHDGARRYLADGFLRDAASGRAGIEVVLCEGRRGTRRDAQLYAIQENARHGLRFNSTDKRRAVERLLRDAEWSRWGNREIARRAGVSKTYVRNLRPHFASHTIGQPRLSRRGGGVFEIRSMRASAPAKSPPTSQPATPPPTPPAKPPTQPGAQSDYIVNWLFYLTQMSPPQLARWRDIIKSRVSVTVLAEAVDVVMREAQQQTTPSQ